VAAKVFYDKSECEQSGEGDGCPPIIKVNNIAIRMGRVQSEKRGNRYYSERNSQIKNCVSPRNLRGYPCSASDADQN